MAVDEEALRRVLAEELGYSGKALTVTVADLIGLSQNGDEDLAFALRVWLADRSHMTEVACSDFSALQLCSRGLTYPCALLTIGWLREDYAAAAEALSVIE